MDAINLVEYLIVDWGSSKPFSSYFSGAAKATELYSETLPDQQCCWFHSTMSFFERHGICVFCLCF